MAVYRPRMVAVLDVPFDDGTVTLPIRVRSATLESNDHLHADELELVAEWSDVGIDPRFVHDANVAFWLEDVGDDEFRDIRQGAARFLGIVHTVERHGTEGGLSVSIKAQDYTSLFIVCKPFPNDGVPRYTDTLLDAWKRVCDSTGVYNVSSEELVSTVTALRDRLEFRGGVDPGTIIGKAAAQRVAGSAGPIPVKPNSDAWTIWLQCVGMLGLVSFIEGNKCVVTTTVDLFDGTGNARPPVLAWGSNILDFRESARGKVGNKGVAITSFDPLTGTTLEAFFPPPGDARLQHQRPTAKRSAKAKPTKVETQIRSEDYDYQSYPGITDENVLVQIAEAVWDQRSRQELEGSLSTAEFQVGDDRGGQSDILSLRSGDSLVVQVDPELQSGTFSSLTPTGQVQYLIERGYSADLAQLMASTSKTKMQFGFTFKTRKVRTQLEASNDAGRFRIDVDYWNRFELG